MKQRVFYLCLALLLTVCLLASCQTGSSSPTAGGSSAYTVKYQLDGGVNGDNPTEYTENTPTFTLRPATKEGGYVFGGWYTSRTFDENTRVTQIEKGTKGNITLYAKWTMCGIKSAPDFEIDESGEYPTLLLSVFKEVSHIDLADKISVHEGCTWKLYEDFEGLKEKPLKALSLQEGNNYAYIIVFHEDGQTFVRYLLQIYRGDIFYPIHYDLGGVSVANPNPAQYAYSEENDFALLDLPNAQMAFFDGWYTSKEFTEESRVTVISKGSKGAIALYAKWVACAVESSAGYGISYGGEYPTVYISVGEYVTGIDLANKITVSRNCTWKLFADVEGTVELPLKAMSLNLGENFAYIFVYHADGIHITKYLLRITRISYMDFYTVTFDGVDGVPSKLVAAGSPVEKPANPEKENYSFDGWFFGDEKWNFSKPVEGNLTLTAKFIPKTFSIIYNLGGVDAENPNPDTYAYNEKEDLYLAPLADSADEMFFLGWSTPAIEAGTSGEMEVTARWIAKEKVLRAYGFEPNSPDGKTYIHYAEMQGEKDDESTWWTAPNGTKQYYQSPQGTGSYSLYIQAVWAPVLNPSTGVEVFSGWKSEKTLPLIEYGYNAEGEIVNAWLSSTYGPKVVTGFQTYTTSYHSGPEKYSVSAFFGFYDAVKAGGVEDVVINIDFRMKGETAFPINFYLRGDSNYDNGQNRVNALAIAGNGDIVVGEDTINADCVVYVDGNGNKIGRSVIGNVGDGKWHTISLEMTQSSIGYDVVIKVDGVKLGNTLSMHTNINFSGENALTQLMIYGGNLATVAQVEALGADYKCTCEFDNFVIYAK